MTNIDTEYDDAIARVCVRADEAALEALHEVREAANSAFRSLGQMYRWRTVGRRVVACCGNAMCEGHCNHTEAE